MSKREITDKKTHTTVLLGDGDPPAVTICNPDGRGPGVLLCDHASKRVPEKLGTLGLPEESFDQHIAYDIGAQGVAERLAISLDMPCIIAGYSRLVIDMNRPEDDFTSIREIYDGAIIPGNRRLSEDALEARRRELLRPYHDAVDSAITEKENSLGTPAIISIHSCTPVYLDQHRPWHIGVLSNVDRRMAERVLQRLTAYHPDLTIGDNKPYSGMDGYGYTIEQHVLPKGHPNILFEIRQDLIADEQGQAAYAEILTPVLQDVLSDPSLFTPFRG